MDLDRYLCTYIWIYCGILRLGRNAYVSTYTGHFQMTASYTSKWSRHLPPAVRRIDLDRRRYLGKPPSPGPSGGGSALPGSPSYTVDTPAVGSKVWWLDEAGTLPDACSLHHHTPTALLVPLTGWETTNPLATLVDACSLNPHICLRCVVWSFLRRESLLRYQ